MSAETILYEDRESSAEAAQPQAGNLWLSLPELGAATGWVLKPEGVCKDEICVPVPDSRRHELLRGEPDATMFNLSEFARLIEQPFAHDEKHSVWYFGRPGWEWKSGLQSREAPDFSLPDLDGKMHRLSELRGNKVFLLFWASW
jgi:AhpC/TSA family